MVVPEEEISFLSTQQKSLSWVFPKRICHEKWISCRHKSWKDSIWSCSQIFKIPEKFSSTEISLKILLHLDRAPPSTLNLLSCSALGSRQMEWSLRKTISSSLLSDFSPQRTFSFPARNVEDYATTSNFYKKYLNICHKKSDHLLLSKYFYLDQNESVKLGDGADAVLHLVLGHLENSFKNFKTFF